MEAETDGMKSAALWRGSPGAKILLSHIPINPTRRLGSLSHHSKDPHGSPPYLPPPYISAPPSSSVSESLTTPVSDFCFYWTHRTVCIHLQKCIDVDLLIRSAAADEKNSLYDRSYWNLLRDGLYCHSRVQIVFWPKTWEKHCTIHLH